MDLGEQEPGLGLEALGRLVEGVDDAMVPAPLLLCGGIDIPQPSPDPQAPIADDQLRRGQAAGFQVAQDVRPALGRLPMPWDQRDQLLPPVAQGRQHRQDCRRPRWRCLIRTKVFRASVTPSRRMSSRTGGTPARAVTRLGSICSSISKGSWCGSHRAQGSSASSFLCVHPLGERPARAMPRPSINSMRLRATVGEIRIALAGD